MDDKSRFDISILLCYRHLLRELIGLDPNILEEISDREGVQRIPDFQSFRFSKGIDIHIFDLTSLMSTHTFEDLVGCVAMAMARQAGYKAVVFSSGGNLGVSLAHYAKRAGIEAYSFQPVTSIPYLDEAPFRGDNIHLYGVAPPENTRMAALQFAEYHHLPVVPKSEWRYAAFQTIGQYLVNLTESLEKKWWWGCKYRWLAQTTSAGFGPLGIYRAFQRTDRICEMPSLLCVQQEANCPAYVKWAGLDTKPEPKALLLPKLFDPNPDQTFGTYEELFGVLHQSSGNIVTISQEEFSVYITPGLITWFGKNHIPLTLDSEGKPIHKAGLMALTGILKAIKQGIIKEGPVVCCLTEGTQPLNNPAAPERIITPED